MKRESIKKSLTLIPPYHDSIVGREDDIRQLRRLFDVQNIVQIHSKISGTGKSSVAKTYLHRYQDQYDYVGWIQFSNSFQDAVVTSLNLNFHFDGHQGSVYKQVLGELKKLSGKKLLIIDNLEQEPDFKEFSQSLKNFHFLVTSKTDLGFVKHTLEPLNLESLTTIFKSHCSKPIEEGGVKRLLMKYQSYGFIIEMLAKIFQTSDDLTIQKIEDVFSTNVEVTTALTDQLSRGSVEDTPQLELIHALSEICELSSTQKWILQQFSILPSLEIKKSQLLEFFHQKGDVEINYQKELKQLIEFGWITQTKSGYHCPSIIRIYMRCFLKPVFKDCERLIQFYVEKFTENPTSVNPVREALFLPPFNSILSSIRDKTPEMAMVHYFLGLIYKDVGQIDSSLEFLLMAKESYELSESPHHSNLAAIYNNIAVVYKRLGLMEDSLKHINKSLHLAERTFDDKHLELAVCYNNHSVIYRELRQFEEALKYAKKAMVIRESTYDSNHPQLIACFNNISVLYKRSGDSDSALEYAMKGIKIAETAGASKNAQIATSYSHISMIYKDLGQYKAALVYAKTAKEIWEDLVDNKHPNLAASYSNVAMIYKDLELYDIALTFATTSTTIYEEIFDPLHPNLAVSYNNLAVIYQGMVQLEKALLYSKKSVQIWETVVDSDHHILATNYRNIGLIYQDLGQNEDAAGYIKKALQIQKQSIH